MTFWPFLTSAARLMSQIYLLPRAQPVDGDAACGIPLLYNQAMATQ
jgi:hypothetical protein